MKRRDEQRKREFLRTLSIGRSEADLINELSVISKFSLREQVRILGFTSVDDLVNHASSSRRSLHRWVKTKPDFFIAVLIGAAKKKHIDKVSKGYLKTLQFCVDLNATELSKKKIVKLAGFSSITEVGSLLNIEQWQILKISRTKPDYFTFLVAAATNFRGNLEEHYYYNCLSKDRIGTKFGIPSYDMNGKPMEGVNV